MVLFAIEPTGSNIIIPNGARSYRKNSNSNRYNSEYGRTPEQAANIRMFMLGVAQTISGVFLITVGGPASGRFGVSCVVGGIVLMGKSLNDAYADYERAKLDFQAIESKMTKACENDK